MPPGLERLKNIVVLMMENRSFDHLLGFLKAEDPRIDGLTGTESNPDTTGASVRVSTEAEYQGQLDPDPGHHWDDVNVQIFGNDKGIDDGSPKMQGFVKRYFAKMQNTKHSHNIMKCFPPDAVPVITTLARKFAVCDRWFSSLPGPTVPNRAFAHFGTSFGKVDNGLKIGDNGRSIYSRLLNAGRSTKLYYFDQSSASVGFTFLLKNQPQTFGDINQFLDACDKGELPDYSFVEPNYSDHANMLASDQHPDHNVLAGEKFIATVYNAIRGNDELWERTLLLILYDEHGGIFDHVTPPAIQPDGDVDPDSGFKFDRLGIRVPAVFVSPWIKEATVLHMQYEHASIPSTVAQFFVDDSAKRLLTAREQRCNNFLKDAELFSLDKPRTDPLFFDMGGADAFAAGAGFGIEAAAAPTMMPGTVFVPQPPPSAYNPNRPLSVLLADHVAEIHAQEQQLPPDQRTKQNIGEIKTEAQAAAYIGEVTRRLQAAGMSD
jgi:phospholipase C